MAENSNREPPVQLQSTNAQTPGETEEHQRPESKTNQQLAEPNEICKTSIPGSNPGGASKFLKKKALLVRRRYKRAPVDVPRLRGGETLTDRKYLIAHSL
jgi:hypothetical protein